MGQHEYAALGVELRRLLARASELDAEERKLAKSSYLEENTYEEICSMLCAPPPSCLSHYYLASMKRP